MAVVKPFRALRYDEAAAGPLETLVAQHPADGEPVGERTPAPAGGPGRRVGLTYSFVMPMRLSAAAACGDSCPVTGTRRPPTDGQAIGASVPSAAYSGSGVLGLAAGVAGASGCAARRRDFFITDASSSN